MKKKAFGLSLAVLGSMLLTAQMPSFAEEGENSEDFQGPYITLGIGASFPNDTTSDSWWDYHWYRSILLDQRDVGTGYDLVFRQN